MTDEPRRVSIKEQAVAVERAAVNLAGHLTTLYGLKRQRPQEELTAAEWFLRDLRAAALTMRWVADHEAEIRKQFGGPSE